MFLLYANSIMTSRGDCRPKRQLVSNPTFSPERHIYKYIHTSESLCKHVNYPGSGSSKFAVAPHRPECQGLDPSRDLVPASNNTPPG